MSILFCDMDGTLLRNDREISKYSADIIRDYTGRGNTFVIATGRPMFTALQPLERADIMTKGTYILSYNGAMIYDCGEKKTMFSLKLPKDLSKELWKLSMEFNIFTQAFSDKDVLVPREGEHINYYSRGLDVPRRVATDIDKELDFEPYKLLSIELKGQAAMEDFRKEVLKRYGEVINAVYSTEYYMEMFDNRVDKGKSALWLCEKLGIDPLNSYGAGDALNDVSLLGAVKHAIAMKNSDKRLFPYAEIITDETNDEDGLAKAIIKYLL